VKPVRLLRFRRKPRGHRRWLLVILFFGLAQEITAQNTLISVPNRRDMVFDHAGRYLYITTSNGLVKRYNLSTNQVDGSYDLGGSLLGIDIDPTDSFLLVAPSRAMAFYRVNLAGGSITSIPFTPKDQQELGAWSVAIASNGIAFGTTEGIGGPIRQIDLASNAIAARPLSGTTETLKIFRSADHSRLYFQPFTGTGGTIFTYDAVTDTFGPNTSMYAYGTDTAGNFISGAGAVSRDGKLLGSRPGLFTYSTIDTAPDVHHVWSFDSANGGLAFDGSRDVLYATDNVQDVLIGYDVNTGREIYRQPIGEDLPMGAAWFGTGTLVASPDGRHAAVATPTGVRVLNLPQSYPDPSDPVAPGPNTLQDIVFDGSGNHVYVTSKDGFVWPYNMAAAAYEKPFFVGGAPNAIDISADDSFLVIGQYDDGLAEAALHRVDLPSGAVTNLTFRKAETGEYGITGVALTASGTAVCATRAYGRTREIDPLTGQTAILTGGPADAKVRRGVDRTRLCLVSEYYAHESYNLASSYSDTTKSFTANVALHANASTAVNRDGSLVGLRVDNVGSLRAASDFSVVHGFDGLDSGIAFDGVRDRIYGVNTGGGFISGYNTTTFTEEVRIPIDEPVMSGPLPYGSGNMAASPDGRYVGLLTATGMRIFDVTIASPPPSPTPTPSSTPTPSPTATAVPTPTPPAVGLTAAPTSVGKGGTATFTISLNASTSQDVTVNYSMSGNAVAGADYTLSGTPNQVVISSGQTSTGVTLTVTTMKTKGKEKATMTLNAGSGYQLPAGKRRKAKPPKVTVTINNK
jgi:hypothetical protein